MDAFEDFSPGDVREFGSREVTRGEIVEFAERYDPQPFHVDPDAAAEGPYGGLIASGWHTASVTMRLLVDGFLADSHSLGAPAVDELRWPAPVRPGDALSVRSEVIESRPSESRPGRGVVRFDVTTLADGEREVMTMNPVVLFARRDHS